MDEKIDFGKHKGVSYLEVPIDYLIYMQKKINEDKEGGGFYDEQRLETIEYWLNERYLENDEHDRSEEWKIEHDKVKEAKRKPIEEVEHSLTAQDVASFIMATYGNNFSLLIAESIYSQLNKNEFNMPVI